MKVKSITSDQVSQQHRTADKSLVVLTALVAIGLIVGSAGFGLRGPVVLRGGLIAAGTMTLSGGMAMVSSLALSRPPKREIKQLDSQLVAAVAIAVGKAPFAKRKEIADELGVYPVTHINIMEALIDQGGDLSTYLKRLESPVEPERAPTPYGRWLDAYYAADFCDRMELAKAVGLKIDSPTEITKRAQEQIEQGLPKCNNEQLNQALANLFPHPMSIGG